jgi:alanyl-tRNA synthetase
MSRTSGQIRREFIQFFEDRGHTFVASSSLLPADDPTLLWARAPGRTGER